MERAYSPVNVCASFSYPNSSTYVYLAVGDLLNVPTHTVNMTTLRSTHNLWQSYSMSPYEVCYILSQLIKRTLMYL